MWKGVLDLVDQIKRCEAADATAAGVAMAYICIDTMAFLAMPVEKTAQTRDDFIGWVDEYLKGHPDQPYHYQGIDVYAARCAVLHKFGSEAQLHAADSTIKVFGYHDGGKHFYDPSVSVPLVLIGTASFLNDVTLAVENFMKRCQADTKLCARVEARLPKVLNTIPAPNQNCR